MTKPNETESIDDAIHDDDVKVLAYGRLADEIRELLQAGLRPDVALMAEKYPELAEEVSELVPAFTMLEDIGQEPPDSPADVSETGTLLGDYRIVREIGRGGMGVVYEAWQISLERRVALKVLPFAAVLDRKQLQRFKNEARIAAQLVHQSIVPVHAVGSDRGVHFFAMQYVDGRTLSRLIDELRDLGERRYEYPLDPNWDTVDGRGSSVTVDNSNEIAAQPSTIATLSNQLFESGDRFFRSIAQLCGQAAEALEYAHGEGVVHRDIKPSNLMVDDRGRLWITDFGLAHVDAAQSLTITGDLLGTLRYMSPEQALAQRVVVDQKTDIYSLGATLYELVTLQPAFGGQDRRELLRQIAFEEPAKPRRLNRSIPVDLETILLKAMEKNPHDRYTTAGDMAEDLHRFVDDLPIRARRPTLVNRSFRWYRRNKLVAALSTCLALTIGVGVFALADRARVISPSVNTPSSELNLRLVHREGIRVNANSELYGNVSPDGRLIAFPNWSTANVALFNLETGARRDLTTEGTWMEESWQYGEEAVWSHDSKQLAYNWFQNGSAQLRVTAADGSDRRVAYETHEDIVWPHSWSGDGRQLLASIGNREQDMRVALVEASEGTARTLKTFAPPLPHKLKLSPNGHYVVYSRSPGVDEAPRDLYLLDTQSREALRVIDHPAHDYAPFWTPDGRWIVFLSDRGGSTGLWALRFRDGSPDRSPQRVYAPLEWIDAKGFDKHGSYYYVNWRHASNVYTAEVDFLNNAVVGPPRRLDSKYEGHNLAADWSADGAKLAYVSRTGSSGLKPRLTIWDLQTGNDRELRLGSPLRTLYHTTRLRWNTSGNSLLVLARGERELLGLYQVDVQSSRVNQFLIANTPAALGIWAFSADGDYLYSVGEREITRINVEDGSAQSIYRLPASREGQLRGLAVSPDGQYLAVVISLEEVRILTSDGNDVRSLYRYGSDGRGVPASRSLAWTPDATRLIFGTHDGDDISENMVSLWQVPVAEGEPQALGIAMSGLHSPRIHPDGRRLMFIAQSPEGESELWAIDNMLAHLNAGR